MVQKSGERQLLLAAARQLPRRLPRISIAKRELVPERPGGPLLRGARDDAEPRDRPREGKVVRDRHAEREALVLAIFRQQTHPLSETFPGWLPLIPIAAHPYASGAHGIEAKQRAQHLRPARANQTRNAEDLAASQREAGAVRQVHTRQRVQLERDLAGLVRHARVRFGQTSTCHRFDDPRDKSPVVVRSAGHVAALHAPPVPQHGVTPRHTPHLFEKVADVDNGDATFAEPIDHLEQPFGFRM